MSLNIKYTFNIPDNIPETVKDCSAVIDKIHTL